MGRAPSCDKANVKKGPWPPEEDLILKQFIEKHGTGGNWISLPHRAGLKRCGKSCRLRWLNYLRPNIKHGEFSDDEDRIICTLYSSIGSRWSIIAAQLPGRTDNDIKNYWNTKLKKKLLISSSTNNSGTSATMLVPSTFPDHHHHHTNINLFSHHHSPYQVSSPSSTYYDQKPILMNSSNHLNNNNNTATYSPPNLMSLLSDNQSQHSCSSSDNGSTSNQVGYGTSATTPAFVGSTHEQNLAYDEGFYNFNITSGVEEDHDEVHKSSSLPTPSGGGVNHSYDPWNERQNGLWSDHQNHQQLEEIKQLVSSNPNHNHNSGWNFFMADAQGKFMMYY